jgi:ferredoxin
MKKITFIIGGKSHEVEYEEGDSLLDCALKHDLNPPYSCMEGVCSACKATVVKGKVDFPDDTILDESEVSSGSILTCQAKLAEQSGEVVISYDL